VLHISILRFGFNIDDMSRSKSQNTISYPLQLDMGEFLPRDASGSKQPHLYELKGVLMHKGKSAHHGHYVAQIHDESCVARKAVAVRRWATD
jgi:ubiquitin carboxyl-terminal hydrolase 48